MLTIAPKPFFGLVAGLDRDGHAHQVQAVAGRVGVVVAEVDPADPVEVVDVVGLLVEVDVGLQAERDAVNGAALPAVPAVEVVVVRSENVAAVVRFVASGPSGGQ